MPNQPEERDNRPLSQAQVAFDRAVQGDESLPSTRQGAAVVRFLHQLNLDGATYAHILESRSDAAINTAFTYLEQHLEQLDPKDPLERLLAIQLLWQHTRISKLCIQETTARTAKESAAVRSAIDQAMNTFRRQVKALRDLQSPRPLNLIRGGQVNVGDGQVVTNNQVNGNDARANEEGCEDGEETVVPAHTSGESEPPSLGSSRAAVDALNRASNGRGKAHFEPQRAEARAPQRRRPRS